MITPQDIHEQDFGTSFRGYDKDEVDAFLQAVADSYQAILAENINLKDRLIQLENQLRQVTNQGNAGVTTSSVTGEKSLAELLIYVKDISNQIIEAAKHQATLILQEATLRARLGAPCPPDVAR